MAVFRSLPLPRGSEAVSWQEEPEYLPGGGLGHADLGPAVPTFDPDLLRSSRFGRVALILAMLASTGAGASLTWTLMDDQRPVTEVTGSIATPPPVPAPPATIKPAPPEGGTAVPHSVWAPFVKSIPSISFRQPAKRKPAVELASLGPTGMIPPPRANGVRSWRYQLQSIDPGAVARSPEDLAVIDTDGEKARFSRADVARMQRKPDGSRRIVLAYLSIGEAEDYRFYWKPEWQAHPPAWLGGENRNWRHNYAVRFWDPAWQAIVFKFVDRILAAGFDGVYLDRLDAFETQAHQGAMIDLVDRISKKIKAKRPGALVIAQNGDALLAHEKFRHAIDGFAREDLFYGEDRDGTRNNPDSIRTSIRRLRLLSAENKPVFVVEYPHNAAQADTARREIAQEGFIGLIARRQLDRL
jgi:cysteinyl-tRNA synthetase